VAAAIARELKLGRPARARSRRRSLKAATGLVPARQDGLSCVVHDELDGEHAARQVDAARPS
jgi:hypothetical protein